MCCGTGAALRHLRPFCRDRVVGIDFSRAMLTIARRVTADAPGEAPIDLVCGNVLHMPFNAAFDVAVCFGALWAEYARESRRSLSRKSSKCSSPHI